MNGADLQSRTQVLLEAAVGLGYFAKPGSPKTLRPNVSGAGSESRSAFFSSRKMGPPGAPPAFFLFRGSISFQTMRWEKRVGRPSSFEPAICSETRPRRGVGPFCVRIHVPTLGPTLGRGKLRRPLHSAVWSKLTPFRNISSNFRSESALCSFRSILLGRPPEQGR